ncbi:MAG: hypothetical protein JNL83_18020 [Myxococcales bacterium]|nr:hypothetical protein [Myxococcales bacterium]
MTTKLRSAPLRGPATPRLDHEPAQRAAPRRRQRRALTTNLRSAPRRCAARQRRAVTTNLRSAARRAAGDAAP